MNDQKRLDWLNENIDRLQDVYWHITNEGVTIREAIDKLVELQDTTKK